MEADGGGGQLHTDAEAGDRQAIFDADRGHLFDHGAGDGGDGAGGWVWAGGGGGGVGGFFTGCGRQLCLRRGGGGGVVTWRAGGEMVMRGDNVTMTIDLITPVAMEKELRFAIREGGRTVGAGVVTEITE